MRNAACGHPNPLHAVRCSTCGTVLDELVTGMALSAGDTFLDEPQIQIVADPKGLLEREIKGYKLLRLLGSGGMGSVFLASQTGLKRKVAVKLLSPGLSQNAEFIERFRLEAQILARVDSPYIVAIHDLFEFEGNFCIVMGYAAGGSVARLTSPKLPEAQAAAVIQQAALGLWAAADKGVVHRDIKPDNLLLTANERVVVGDFGLARLILCSDPKALTQAGSIMGTPAFMPPEQWADARSADHRADLYSLGCTLFNLVTACPPFRGPSAANFMRQHSLDPVPDPRDKRPDLSEELAQIIMRLLAKQPEARYQTGRELAQALAPLAQNAWVESPPPLAPRPSETRTASSPGSQEGTGRRVLVVDDNVFNRQLLCAHLKSLGYESREASDGQEALDSLEHTPVDVVLLDIKMPRLDGYTVLERLKTHPRLAVLPVIMISAVDQLESVVRCIRLGAEDYLVKPFNRALLRSRLRLALSRSASPGVSAASGSSTSPHVLVLDDDEFFLELTATLLKAEGYAVSQARDAFDALLCIGNERFDLIISDLSMPDVDGFEFLRILKKKGIRVPVLFTSGSSHNQAEVEALKLGAVDFVYKPIDSEIFLLRVKKALAMLSLLR